MSIGVILRNQSMETNHNYTTWIRTVLVHVKSADICTGIAGDVEKRYRRLPIGKNKEVIGLKKDELGGRIMKEFVELKPRMYSHLTDDGHVDKRVKGTNLVFNKQEIKFEDYKTCLESNRAILRTQQRFRS